MTQKEFVRQLLIKRGAAGVSAHELTYGVKPGITRAASIIHELRREGMDIDTIQQQGEQATYIYRPKLQPLAHSQPISTYDRDKAGHPSDPEELVAAADLWDELGKRLRLEREAVRLERLGRIRS